MTITLPRLPWHWRLRRLLGFDSCRRGILYIPDELGSPSPAEDQLLDALIEAMTKPIGPSRLSRRTRLKLLLGFDSIRQARRNRSSYPTSTMVPLIIRGPLLKGT